jgi:release factor glutamine methyltransferase
VWTTTINLSGWLEAARQALAAITDQPSIEAQALLTGVTGQSRAWIFTHPDAILDPDVLVQLNILVDRRLSGEPLPYLLGQWEFYGISFVVNPAVLIPRPETEMIVDLGREWLQPQPGIKIVIDVGTGSGCIAAALARWQPGHRYYACDISGAAIRVARRNFAQLQLSNHIQLIQADLLTPLAGPFDLICANLPYIPTSTFHELEVAKHEPALALDGGSDGLRLIDRLLEQAVSRLADGGRMLLEIEMTQEFSAQQLARRYFPNAKIDIKYDLAGLPRVILIDRIT